MGASIEMMDCPKCGMADQPVVSFRLDGGFSSIVGTCQYTFPEHLGEHLDLMCSRCDYTVGIPTLDKPAAEVSRYAR